MRHSFRPGTSPLQGTARDETVAEGRNSETKVRSTSDGNCSRMLDAQRAAKKTSFPSQLRSKVEPPRSPVEDLAVPCGTLLRTSLCPALRVSQLQAPCPSKQALVCISRWPPLERALKFELCSRKIHSGVPVARLFHRAIITSCPISSDYSNDLVR